MKRAAILVAVMICFTPQISSAIPIGGVLAYSFKFSGIVDTMHNPLNGRDRDYCNYPIYGDINIWDVDGLQETWGADLYVIEISGQAEYIKIEDIETGHPYYGDVFWDYFFIDDITRVSVSEDGMMAISTGRDSAPSDSMVYINWEGQNSLFFSLYSDVGPWITVNQATFNNSSPVPEPATMILIGFGLIGLAVFKCKHGLSKRKTAIYI